MDTTNEVSERSLPFMLGAGMCFGTGMAAFRYTAGLRGTSSGEVDEEEVERREAMKKLRRRPLSETLEQLGEGRGKLYIEIVALVSTNVSRYLRSRIRGEEATEDSGEVRSRCKGSSGLDAIRNFFGVHNRSRHRAIRIEHFATTVHTTCSYKLENGKRRSNHRTCVSPVRLKVCNNLAIVVTRTSTDDIIRNRSMAWSCNMRLLRSR